MLGEIESDIFGNEVRIDILEVLCRGAVSKVGIIHCESHQGESSKEKKGVSKNSFLRMKSDARRREHQKTRG